MECSYCYTDDAGDSGFGDKCGANLKPVSNERQVLELRAPLIIPRMSSCE